MLDRNAENDLDAYIFLNYAELKRDALQRQYVAEPASIKMSDDRGRQSYGVRYKGLDAFLRLLRAYCGDNLTDRHAFTLLRKSASGVDLVREVRKKCALPAAPVSG